MSETQYQHNTNTTAPLAPLHRYTRWSAALFWLDRELSVENSRMRALHDLRIRELEDLARENDKMTRAACELEDSLVGLQVGA